MPVINIPHRVVIFKGDTMPSFPAHVTLEAVLNPKEVFGEEVLSGRLMLCPHGHDVQMRSDMWHGGIVRARGGRLPKIEAEGPLFDLTLALRGNIATVTRRLETEAAFKRAIGLVAHQLAAFVSAALHAPVDVAELYGNVGDQFFEVQVEGTFEDVVKTLHTATAVQKKMQLLAKVSEAGAPRVFAAYRYLNHARWLAYVGAFPGQFAGEQLLNLNKAVEVLLPGTLDELRKTLGSLDVREEVIELLAALEHVRNQVDVGHAGVEVLGKQEHHDLHLFLVHSMEIVAWLVDFIIEITADGRFEPRPLTGASKKQRAATLARVGEVLKQVNPLQPETFVHKPSGA